MILKNKLPKINYKRNNKYKNNLIIIKTQNMKVI